MPNPNDVQLNPPGSWDEFEDICADLFALEWNDPNVVRYGRQGQSQNGVDIHGKESGADVAAQCKKKSIWPVTELTTSDIDEEVEKAKKFHPKLKKYIVATTAPNDARVIDHVNAMSAAHAKRSLFSVHVYSWTEIVRRIQSHPDLYDKHFGIVVLRKVQQGIEGLPGAVAAAVVERIQAVQAPSAPGAQIGAIPSPQHLALEGLGEAIQRDFESRFSRTLQRLMFLEVSKTDEFIPLAEDVLTHGSPVSQALRREVLLRASRAAAIRGRNQDGQRFLDAALALAGPSSDAPARARLVLANGDVDGAIRLLRDAPDPDARSVLLNVLATKRGDEAALEWFAHEGLTVASLTSHGVLGLVQIYLRRNDFDRAKGVLEKTTNQQLAESPYLYFLRGAIRFASVMPVPDRPLAIMGLPLDVRGARPMLGNSELIAELDKASNDFRQVLPLALALGLQEAPRIIEAYISWCDLIHPARKQAAVEELRRDMQLPALALSRIQFAFAYDTRFDPTELLSYLARRDALGGLTRDELRGLLSIHLNRSDARGVATLIAKSRALAEETFGRIGMLSLEIQALAKAGDPTSAKIVLDSNAAEFDAELLATFRAEIAKAYGADPVTEHLKLYEETKTIEALRALVAVLVDRGDHIGIARYAELLYAETLLPNDISLAAQALLGARDSANFARVYEAHPFLKDIDPEFRRAYARQLFRLGRQREAKLLADELVRDYPTHRDFNLEIAIALETGEWESLAQPLAALLESADQQDGASLIRAAHLAQASGQGPMMDLVAAAMKRGDSDPNVLLGGYTLIIEEGLEETRPEAQEWFRKALSLSGTDGPIQRFELKELLAQQVEWNEHTRTIQDNVSRGDMPMVVASAGWRTTLIDIVLRNLVRNVDLSDARRRVTIPLFTGRRAPSAIGPNTTAAFDISALLVLGWLGLLPKAVAAYPRIVLPAGVLTELFEGRRRIRQTQKSRLSRAVEIRNAIAAGRLKVLHAPIIARDTLSTEIGIELAALIREAEAVGGVTVRSAPVMRLGGENREADLSSHQSRLCDMHGLLAALVDLNLVDEATEISAKQYFTLQDRGWPASAPLDTKTTIFLDGLTVVYLQTTGLLELFLRHFKNVFIHDSTAEEAAVLIENDKHVSDVLKVIDDIRTTIRAANAAGKIKFGPKRAASADGEQDHDTESTLNLLSDLCGAEVAYFDDRFLNKEAFVTDPSGARAKSASTLDLIEELRARGMIDEQERRRLRYRLRVGGAMLMPVDAGELVAAARRNRQNETPEFRVVRDTLDLARLAEMPQFPSEVPWYLGIVHATRGAITQVWNEEESAGRASEIARAIVKLHPLAEDWIGRWTQGPPPGWIAAVRRTMIGSLCVPAEIDDVLGKQTAYQTWLEAEVISVLRMRAPDTYQQVVGYLRELIQMPSATMAKVDPCDRALFALRRLSPTMQSDVLSDGSVARYAGFDVSQPAKLAGGLTIERKHLFDLFQKAVDQEELPSNIEDSQGIEHPVQVAMDGDDAVMTLGQNRTRFSLAGLLTANVGRRTEIGERCLVSHTLTSNDREAFEAILSKEPFTHDDFFAAINILAASPENFAIGLRQQAQTGKLSKADFLPTLNAYWDNLIAQCVHSQSLKDFIGNELDKERDALIARNPAGVLETISLSFAAPEMVPVNLLEKVGDDTLLGAIHGLLESGDPFALAGAFDLCASRLTRDGRFAEVGDAILDRLFGDPKRLCREFVLYGTGFVIATSHLAEHQVLQRQPVYWRRLAATAHAALVTRSLGEASEDGEPLLGWAMRMSGRIYYLSVLSDANIEPRWRPDWIEATYLAADLYGRLFASTKRAPEEAIPAGWREKLSRADRWIAEEKVQLATTFPAILQGAAPASEERPAPDTPIGELYASLIRDPTAENFVLLTPVVWAFGFLADAREAALTVVQSIRSETKPHDPGLVERVLGLGACIASMTRDKELGELVSQVCVERAAATREVDSLLATVVIMLECSAANPDRNQALATLARRLENLAFVSSPAALDDLLQLLRILQTISEPLENLLGRAIATARLGRSDVA